MGANRRREREKMRQITAENKHLLDELQVTLKVFHLCTYSIDEVNVRQHTRWQLFAASFSGEKMKLGHVRNYKLMSIVNVSRLRLVVWAHTLLFPFEVSIDVKGDVLPLPYPKL